MEESFAPSVIIEPHTVDTSEAVTELRHPLLRSLKELALDLLHDWVAMIGLIGLIILLVMAVTAPHISPYDPAKQSLRDRFVPPSWMEGGSPEHFLGTDSLGRDLFSRLIFGARVSLTIGFITLAVTATFGTFIGVISGYYGGTLDEILMRWVDIQTAFPGLLVAITIIAMIGPSVENLILVLAINGWLIFARIARGMTLSLREQVFVRAARVAGCRDRRIIIVHILPNLISPLLTISVMELARFILAEAALSYLGLGIQPPDSSWGLILAQGRDYLVNAWWVVTFPGVVIAMTVLFINMVAGWLRSVSDPHQRFKLRNS
ncbi:MAG: ABC transporter permease [Anaerolineae bacterium]|nr:ABC transporter permease [Anaerolineae bacterium]NUQ05671.1 ABC transporter permease [Anaerolineae bacterium]